MPQDFLSTVLDVLTPEDVRVLVESEDELCRRGRFERAFPSPSSSRYLRYFECPRYKNLLLDQWEQKHWSDRSKGGVVEVVIAAMSTVASDTERTCFLPHRCQSADGSVPERSSPGDQ